MAGRGAGKTRSGAEWCRELVKQGYGHLGLIAPTAADARDVMVEGISGIQSVCWVGDRTADGNELGRPIYEPSKRRLTWANGAQATLFSAEEPERLRGPQHDALWADELAAWQEAEATWDMAMFGLRLGHKPRAMVTTTPKPIPIVREIVKSPHTIITRGTTWDNRAHLAQSFFDQIVAKYEGTRLGRQELSGEILEDVEGALWKRGDIRYVDKAPELVRVVVSIDPPASSTGESALAGIVAAGIDAQGNGYVLTDRSGRKTPREWATTAVVLYDEVKADRIVAEANQGGEMVSHTIDSVRPNLPVTLVHASRAKQARAEPVAAIYEQGRVFHVGAHPDLEDELCVSGDALIATGRGLVAAKDVNPNDLVLTRSGLASLKWCGQTGIRPTLLVETSAGSYLKLTHSHPVFVEGSGFVRADALKIGDKVLECRNLSNARSLSSTENATFSTTTATTRRAARGAIASFTAICGRLLTVQFRRLTRFITRTSTGATTPSGTSSASRSRSTSCDTRQEARSASRPPREAGGGRQNGASGNLGRSNASSAERSSAPPGNDQCIARGPVVVSSTVSAIKEAGLEPVWNFTVDGSPEFFAGNILVHNCTWEPLTGAPSPDRLDALVWALTELMVGQGAPVYPAEEKAVVVEPIRIPSHWPRVAAIDCDRLRFVTLWGAWDRANDVVYLTEEYVAPMGAVPVHAEAIRKRGPWIPALFELEARGRGKDEGVRIGERLIDLSVLLYECPLDEEGGVADVTARLNSARLKVFSTCREWITEFRRYRRDPKKDELVEDGNHLMRATQMLASQGLKVAVTENQARSDADEPDWGAATRNRVTGY